MVDALQKARHFVLGCRDLIVAVDHTTGESVVTGESVGAIVFTLESPGPVTSGGGSVGVGVGVGSTELLPVIMIVLEGAGSFMLAVILSTTLSAAAYKTTSHLNQLGEDLPFPARFSVSNTSENQGCQLIPHLGLPERCPST